jgi:hypothetical protein
MLVKNKFLLRQACTLEQGPKFDPCGMIKKEGIPLGIPSFQWL